MFRKTQDFIRVWTDESAATIKVFEAVTEGFKRQEVAEGFRNLERLAWHITATVEEMGSKIGIVFKRKEEADEVPGSMAYIISVYKILSHELVDAVGKWPEADLEKVDNMYGENWVRGSTLMVLVTHQAHHRGQMTVLLRQAGLKPPGVVGPVKEDWVSFGQPVPKV
jgi:uncharacterized damage-inducible protein DinB